MFGRPGQHWTFVVTVAVVVSLVTTDVVNNSVRRYWLGHSMASAIISGLVLVAATVLVLDELLQRRETAKYRRLATEASVAVIDRVNEVFRVCNDLYNRRTDLPQEWLSRDARTSESGAVRERVTALAQDQEWMDATGEAASRLTDGVVSTLTAWSPVLLQHPELVRLANRLSLLLSALRFLRTTSTLLPRPG
jgi:hypothetical protein